MSAHSSVSLGCGSGFWGDAFDPALALAERGQLDYLCFDFLAELTMAILQRSKAKGPNSGYVPDMVDWMSKLSAPSARSGTRLVCNGGGANPAAGGRALAAALRAGGEEGRKLAIVSGDDLLPRLDEMIQAGIKLTNLTTGDEDFARIRSKVVSANAYMGSEGIVEALDGGADIVIAGRVTDSALFVGSAMHHLGWTYDQPDLVASAITVGHVMECAAGCTGGMSSRFAEMPRMGEVGFPIGHINQDGSAVVTKLSGSGGRVDEFTVKEHLVYEIGDPNAYLTPDGVADFTKPRLAQDGPDRVAITGSAGAQRPDTLKLLVGYADGWIGEGILMFPWPRALGRARKAEETLRERFVQMGLKASMISFDYIGVNMLHGPAAPWPQTDDLNEVGLRVTVRTETRDEADKVRRACSQLWIMGPGGSCFGVPIKPRPAFGLWSTLIPREFAQSKVEHLVS